MASSRGVRAALVTVFAATALSACGGGGDAVSAKVLAERAEETGQRVLARIADVPRYQDDIVSTWQQWVDAEANGDEPDAERWVEWQTAIEIAPDALVTPEQAAATVADTLRGDGWADVRAAGESEYGYELGKDDDLGAGWYVRISFETEPPPTAQNLEILISSPTTTKP